MKKIYTLLAITIGVVSQIDAQQLNQFDQFTKNNMVLNPASTGMEHYTDISGNFRRQWSGFDNAPKSFLLSVSSRLMERKVENSTVPPSIYISNNDLYNSLSNSEEIVSPTPHAFGGYIVSDRNGPFERMSAFLNYAYHLKVSESSTLAFGVGGGYSRRQIDLNSLETVTVNDNTFLNYQNNDDAVSYFDIKAGITYYGRNYFIGYAANQLNRKQLFGSTNGSTGRLNVHHSISAGYIFEINDNLELYPTAIVRYLDATPAAYDAALRLRFDKKIWLGAGYRYDDAVSAQFGMTVYEKFNFGYSYAYSTSEIKNVNDGTHEISLGIMLFNSVSAPTKMW